MQREIKFRGKRIDNGKWAYGYYVKGSTRHCILPDLGGIQIDVVPETIGQYVGFQADYRNVKKDIYEGDILDCSRYTPPSIYRVIVRTIHQLPSEMFGSNRNYTRIIGNIYEHPDLLTTG